MPAAILIHFFIGVLASLAVFLLCARLSGAAAFSLPSGSLVIGIACATLAHFVSPWATPVILVVYAAVSFQEVRAGRMASPQRRGDGAEV